MPSVDARQSTLCLSPHIRKLANGRYEGYIKYRVQGAMDAAPESYVAGAFDSGEQARLAAFRLLQIFRSAVVAPRSMGHDIEP